MVTCVPSLFPPDPPFPTSLQGHESSKLHKIIVRFLLFLFLVISPTGTKADPIPYYCAIFAHSSAGLPVCPVLRSLQGGAGVCSDKAVLPSRGDIGG